MTINYQHTFIDYFFVIILLLFAIRAFYKGLIYELSTSIVLIIALIVAYNFNKYYVNPFLLNYVNLPQLTNIVGFVLCILVFYIILRLIVSSLVSHFKIHPGFIDRVAGMCFGIVKGLIVITIFYAVLNSSLVNMNGFPVFANSFFKQITNPLVQTLTSNLNQDKLDKYNIKEDINNYKISQ